MADENIDIRTRMVGRREFARDAAATARDIRIIESATQDLGNATDRTAQRGFLMNQALFTARRLVYGVTLGFGAAVAGATALGLKFDATMETNQVAFEFFLGSAQEARRELDFLYELAAKTPFQFLDLTTASRQLLAFGFDLDQTNRILRNTADAAAALADPQVIARVVRAFGQIQTKGRVMGDELLQLQEAGIPATQWLRDAFNLTPKQMTNIGALGIPANVAIEVISKGMENRFAGASEKLSKTVSGQLETLRDYSSQLFGEIMRAPFNAIRDSLPGFLLLLQEASATMRDEGFMSMIGVVDNAIGAHGRLSTAVGWVITLFNDLVRIVTQGILPAFKENIQIVAAILVPAFWILGRVVGFVADHLDVLGPVIAVVTFWMAAEATAAAAMFFWHRLLNVVTGVTLVKNMILMRQEQILFMWRNRQVVITKTQILLAQIQVAWMNRYLIVSLRLQAALLIEIMRMRLAVFWTRLRTRSIIVNTAVTKIAVFWTRAWALATAFLSASFLRARVVMATMTIATWAFNAALWANPITWVVIAIVALVAAIVIAIRYWDELKKGLQWVWEKMKAFAAWVKDHWYLFGPAGAIIKIGSWVASKIPGLAEGGQVTSRGNVIVGERGPEMLTLPRGASVTPLQVGQLDMAGAGGGNFNIQIFPSSVNIDGREMAEIIFSHRLDRMARR